MAGIGSFLGNVNLNTDYICISTRFFQTDLVVLMMQYFTLVDVIILLKMLRVVGLFLFNN
ncbi:hypothetical protein XFUD_08590 [Xylella fastidiosa]|uniref:Uncharacterized protein n=1 Tax=Xylella fastidiosa (strain 9a5c) TaxID=160492 RepID=Q9PC03_XYLFA|nr:hypothetical protein XF_1982 [Xylella fastidiosa 9a5c]ALQ95192.1 hypothetical protein XFUD_08590 [Xylella fastidiosa]ETE33007.1 hypothetical protein B398_05125 [Xylella fastidiosa 32]OCA57567.1 hypothetical protein AA93_08415 [Xylella fastidiosa subsp. pauca 11399]OJZ71530.1 hypothetical protein B375_0204665 [Xylella fastidiosa 6c]